MYATEYDAGEGDVIQSSQMHVHSFSTCPRHASCCYLVVFWCGVEIRRKTKVA